MSDAVIAAIITGLATIIAALIGLWRWRSRNHAPPRSIAAGDDPPIFTAARRFATLSTLEAQQQTIQPIEVALSNGTTILSTRQMEACAGSDWELDRIGLYLFEEYSRQPNHAARLLHVQHEFDRLRAATYPRSSLPLFYALRSLLTLLRQQPILADQLRERSDLLHEIANFCAKHGQADSQREIQRIVAKLLDRLPPPATNEHAA